MDIDRYRLGRVIGTGALGTVHEATHLNLGMRVAVKLLQRARGNGPDAARFAREGRALARISHRHVVSVLDFGQAGNLPFLVMELIDGESLAVDLQRGGPFSLERFAEIAPQMLSGLAAIHDAGVVHRDVKPANLLLTRDAEGRELLKIVDFGVSRLIGDPQAITLRGQAVGTPAYMAPEQITGATSGDARTDVYAAGAVLYEMLCGGRPHLTKNVPALTHAIVTEDATPLRTRAPNVPETVAAVIDRAIRRPPEERFGTAVELASALRSALARTPGSGAGRPPAPELRWPGRFVGRERSIVELTALLSSHRLVVVVGPGGIGKTRLAVELLNRRSGAARFCDLREVRDRQGLVAATARALDLEPGGAGDPVARIGEELERRSPLIVLLDNAEQVADEARELLAVWLDRAKGASFLVTSRHRIDLPAATVHELGPLGEADAVALFRDAARRAQPAGDGDEPSAAERIVACVDRIPLAIELAAARLELMDVAELGERLSRTGDAALAGVMEWSWRLLTPPEQSAFAQAAVFRGGFTLEAAEAVIDAGEPVTTVLHALRKKSLLHLEQTAGRQRLNLYVPIAEYARSRLHDLALADAAKDRHASYFAAAGRSAASSFAATGSPGALSFLIAEQHNLSEAALGAADPEVRVNAALALLPLAEAVGSIESPLALYERLIDGLPPDRVGAGLLAELHHARGKCRAQVDRPDAEPDLLRARELASGNRALRGSILITLADFYDRDRLDDGRRAAEEAVELLHGVRRADEGWALEVLGRLALIEGDPRRALAFYERALPLVAGHLLREGSVLGSMAITEMQLGHGQLAKSYYTRAIENANEVGNRREIAICTLGLAACLHDTGDREEALTRALEARELFGRMSAGVWVSMAEMVHGLILRDAGDLDGAFDLLFAARLTLQPLHAPRRGGIVAAFLAATAADAGRIGEAEQLAAEAEELFRGRRGPMLQPLIEIARAHVALARGDRSAARATLSAIERDPPAASGYELRAALRGLSRAVAAASATRLRVSDGGLWFEAAGGPRVDLEGRPTLRRMLSALARARQDGAAELDVATLFEAAWPGERARPDSAATRVYTAIARLRRLGLQDHLAKSEVGYALLPTVEVVPD